MERLHKAYLLAAVTALGVFAMSGTAFAQTTPEDVIESGATSIVDSLTAVLFNLLPVIAPLAAIVIGWQLARRFIRV